MHSPLLPAQRKKNHDKKEKEKTITDYSRRKHLSKYDLQEEASAKKSTTFITKRLLRRRTGKKQTLIFQEKGTQWGNIHHP